MTDRRRSSPSDDLLGKARGEVAGGESPEDYTLSSPIDDYEAATPYAAEPVEQLDHSLDLGEELSPEEIASILRETTEPEPRSEPGGSAPQSASIPAWAKDEPDLAAAPDPTISPSDQPRSPADAIAAPPIEPVDPVHSEPTSDGDDWSGTDRWTTPTTQWEEYEAQRAQKRKARSGMNVPMPGVRALVSLAALLFVVGGAVWNFFDGREPIASVAVGDCFIVGEALEIDQVPIVDCEKKHDSELFAKVDMAVMGSAYPGDEAMFEWLFARCVEQFPAYVGEPYESSEYYIDMFIPLTEAWSDGDTTGLCTIVLVDDDFNIRTVAGSGRNSGSSA